MSAPGKRIAHRYEVVKSLGTGVLGQVFLAWDPMLSREVTIKTLRQDLNLSPEAMAGLSERLKREARNSGVLVHPAAVPLHDMGEDPELGLFLVFPYVDGPTLRAAMAKGPLSAEQIAEIALTLGDLLSSAHEAGVLHRSVRPENIFLGRHGVLVTDFGLSRLTDSATTGVVEPPSPYLSPEVEARGVFTARNDQYAMAMLLYELLTGKPEQGAVNAPDGDDRSSTVLTKLLARGSAARAEDRFPSCRDFGEKVHAVLAPRNTERLSGPASMRLSLSGSAPPPPVAVIDAAEDYARSTRRAQKILGAAGVLVLVVLLFLGRKPKVRDLDADGGAPVIATGVIEQGRTPTANSREGTARLSVPKAPPSASPTATALGTSAAPPPTTSQIPTAPSAPVAPP